MTLARRFSGNIFLNGKMVRGTLIADGDRVVLDKTIHDGEATGTIIPKPFNAHVHTGDSAVSGEPIGSLASVVGPGGFKHLSLEKMPDPEIQDGMERAVSYMEENLHSGFCDFRENGIRGVHIAHRVKTSLNRIVLGRPSDSAEIAPLLSQSDGIGFSSIYDHDLELLQAGSDACRSSGKTFAFHFSEGRREDISRALELRPDFVVHCGKCSDTDLMELKKTGISVAITPRSNYFFGMRPDYTRLTDLGLRVMLGTDNVMMTQPNIFQEMDFLYRVQRSRHRMEPEKIIEISCETFRQVFDKHNHFSQEFVLFRNRQLTPYEVVTRAAMYPHESFALSDR